MDGSRTNVNDLGRLRNLMNSSSKAKLSVSVFIYVFFTLLGSIEYVSSVHKGCDDVSNVIPKTSNVGKRVIFKCDVPKNVAKQTTNCRDSNKRELNREDKYSQSILRDYQMIRLIINNLTMNDSGEYECGYKGKNMAINYTCCFNLTVRNSYISGSEEDYEVTTSDDPGDEQPTITAEMGEYSSTNVPTSVGISTVSRKIYQTTTTYYTAKRASHEASGSKNYPTFTGTSSSDGYNTSKTVADIAQGDNLGDMAIIVFFVLCGVMVALLTLVVCLCRCAFCNGNAVGKETVTTSYAVDVTNEEVVVDKGNMNQIQTTASFSNAAKGGVKEDVYQSDDVEIRTLDEGWEANVAYQGVSSIQDEEEEYAQLRDGTVQGQYEDLNSSKQLGDGMLQGQYEDVNLSNPGKEELRNNNKNALYETVIT